MRRKAAWIAITVVAAVVTMGLSRVLWPSPAGAPTPPSDLLPFFIGLAVVESILFGLGLGFIFFGFELVAQSRQPLWLTYGAYAATAWLLVSWWPHDNLHRTTLTGNWESLLRIDYGFHLTLMASAAILAIFFFNVLRNPSRASA